MKTCICGNTETPRWYRVDKYNKASGHLCNICYHKRQNERRGTTPEVLAWRKEYNRRPEVVARRIQWQRNRNSKLPKRLYNAAMKAKQRGLAWTISLEDYGPLLQHGCFYCAGALEKFGCGLDRVNSDLGYVLENVVPCCRLCNVMKNDLTQDAFYERITTILNNRFKSTYSRN